VNSARAGAFDSILNMYIVLAVFEGAFAHPYGYNFMAFLLE